MTKLILNLYIKFLIEKVCGIEIILYLKNIKNLNDLKKNSIILMNHRTRLDWLFYFCILYRINALNQIKVILKDALKKIPGPSWAMQFGLFIFLKRKWDHDAPLMSQFISYYKKINKTITILIFPEGTNLTIDTITKSNEFAARENYKSYKYVLHPRTSGFNHLFNEMKSNELLDAIHDVTIFYEKNVPENESDFLNGHFPDKINFFVDYHSVNFVLEPEQWLKERWEHKEQHLEVLHEKTNSLTNEEYSKFKLDNELYLYLYAIYWFISLSIIFYLIYFNLYIKIIVISIIIFFIYIEKFHNGIDCFLMK